MEDVGEDEDTEDAAVDAEKEEEEEAEEEEEELWTSSFSSLSEKAFEGWAMARSCDVQGRKMCEAGGDNRVIEATSGAERAVRCAAKPNPSTNRRFARGYFFASVSKRGSVTTA